MVQDHRGPRCPLGLCQAAGDAASPRASPRKAAKSFVNGDSGFPRQPNPSLSDAAGIGGIVAALCRPVEHAELVIGGHKARATFREHLDLRVTCQSLLEE